MANFAIIRAEKLKTLGNISASGQHNFRERETPNADEKRTHLNEHIGPQSTKELTSAVRALLPEKTRKDGVLCIEYFISASHEWFKASGDERQYFADALDWLKDRHGEKNIAGVSIHRDEETPLSPEQLKEALGVDMRGQNSKADVFDVLVKQGKAKDFREAVELVAKAIPASENGSRWSELAEWVLDYEKSQKAPEMTSTGRIPSRFSRPPVIDEGTASLGGLMGVKGPKQAAEPPERRKQGRSM